MTTDNMEKTQKIQIAANGEKYTIHRLPKGFWEAWKQDKEGMKAKGYSPFKRRDRYGEEEWFIRLYNGEFATEEEMAKFRRHRVEEFLQYYPEISTDEEAALANKIEECESVESAIALCRAHSHLFENVGSFLKFAEEEMFNDSISDDIEL